MLTTANLIAIACILMVTVEDLTIIEAIIEDNVTEHNISLNGLNKSEIIGDIKWMGDSEREYRVKNKTVGNTVENKITEFIVEKTTVVIREINKVNTDSDTTRETTSKNTLLVPSTMYENKSNKTGEDTMSEKDICSERTLEKQPFHNNIANNISENYAGSEMMKARDLNSIEKESRTISDISVAQEIGFVKENITKHKYITLKKANKHDSLIRCLWCNSRTVPGCYDPLKVAVRKCEVPTNLCFTRFGADGEEVERDCFGPQAVDATHACTSYLCNDIPASSIPLIFNRVAWKDYLRSLYIFVKRNTNPLRCVSCESSESYLSVLPNLTAKSYEDDCINPPKERVENMSVECRRNEFCEIVRMRGHVTRGCARVPHDSAFIVCGQDECNNHVDIVQENYYSKLYPKYRSKGLKLLSNNIIMYCCLIMCHTGLQ